jgi:Short C-terminal domain
MFGLFGPSKNDILEEGRQAMATVRDVSDTGTRVNGKPRIHLTLEVAPMGEPTFTVEKKLLVSDDAFPSVGQQLPVRFLPEDRDRVEIDERALEMTQAQIVTSQGTVPAAAPPPPPPPPAPPPVPDPSAHPDAGTDLSSLIQQAMASGNVYQSGNAEVIDARNVPGLRDQMAKTLAQYGIQLPETPGTGAPTPGAPPAAASDEDPVAKLEKLSALHKQGVLTDAEFQAAKAKILGEL